MSQDSILVIEFVGSMSLLQVARVIGRKVGSSVCELSSTVAFSEGLPCGMSIAEDVREVGLRCELIALCQSSDYQKGLEK